LPIGGNLIREGGIEKRTDGGGVNETQLQVLTKCSRCAVLGEKVRPNTLYHGQDRKSSNSITVAFERGVGRDSPQHEEKRGKQKKVIDAKLWG